MARFIIVIILTLLIVFSSNMVFAQEEVRILPSNPFYFLKEWQRGIKVALSGPRKAEVIFNVLSDKAKDFQKSHDYRALASYRESEKQLLGHLDSASINLLRQRLLAHILNNYDITDPALLSKVFRSEEFLEAVESQVFTLRELVAVELLEATETSEIVKLKYELLIKFLGRLIADESLVNEIKNLKGDALRRLVVLDQARELAGDADIKNVVNIVRQQIFESVSKEIGIGQTQSVLESAKSWVVFLGGQVKPANQFLTRAQFNLEQAEQFLGNNNYANAFGQASLAVAVAKNTLFRLSYDDETYQEAISQLKDSYNAIELNIKTDNQAKKLYDEIKKGIQRLSRPGTFNVPLLISVQISLAALGE